jgi:TolB protein
MKKRLIYHVFWAVALLSLFLSACTLDLAGAAGDWTPTPESTATPTLDPTLPTEAPVGPTATATPIPPPSGRILFLSDREGAKNLYVMDALGANPTRLTNVSPPDDRPRWSSDGSRVAFTSTIKDNADIYLVNADGSGLVRLTDDPAKDSSPTWSPDGQRIAFESYRDGNFEIYVINVDGSGLTRLTNDPGGDSNPQWSPVDNNRIAYVSSNQSGNSDIFLINPDGTGLFRLTNDAPPSSDPVWSWDGKQIAYRTSFAGDQKQICVIGADGSTPRTLTEVGSYGIPSWSKDGGRLAFIATHKNDATNIVGIDILNLLDGNLKSWTTPNAEPRSDPVWSPDGAYVVFQANAHGDMEIFILTVDTGAFLRLTTSTGYDGEPVWH